MPSREAGKKLCWERDQEPGLWNPLLPFDEIEQLKLESTTTTAQTFAVFTFWWIGTRCSTGWRQHPHSRKKAAQQGYPTVWSSPQGQTGGSVSPLLMHLFWKNRASLSASNSCSPLSHDTIMDWFITSWRVHTVVDNLSVLLSISWCSASADM